MARVKCRCGETLQVTGAEPDRLTCPRCGAKIRVRRAPASGSTAPRGDGYLRFSCPCGRRLKVPAATKPEAGRCPDCGRIVPVPANAWASTIPPLPTAYPGQAAAGARTEDMDAADLERLERWARSLAASPLGGPAPGTENTTSHPELRAMSPGQKGPPEPPAAVNMEAGMRVCPRCRKPLHMSATVCRTCGEPVPRR